MDFLIKVGKFFKIAALASLVLGLLFGLFLYFASYSEGFRAGTVYKLSNKGILFKTYEGEMNLGNYVNDDTKENLNTKIWKFSIEGDQKKVMSQLENAVLKGTRVKLFYKEKYMRFFWKGETKYFIFKVDTLIN